MCLICLSGDVHPNSGPEISRPNSSSSLSSKSSVDLTDISSYFSFMHNNFQSIKQKLDTLFAEFKDFDILSFSETWLNGSTPNFNFHDPDQKEKMD
jgi:hypothetical protein